MDEWLVAGLERKDGKFHFIFLKSGEFCSCGEFLQDMVNLSGVVNKIETHQSAVIRNGTVLSYMYCISWLGRWVSRVSNFQHLLVEAFTDMSGYRYTLNNVAIVIFYLKF